MVAILCEDIQFLLSIPSNLDKNDNFDYFLDISQDDMIAEKNEKKFFFQKQLLEHFLSLLKQI